MVPFLRKKGSKFWVIDPISSLTPWGGPTPDLTLEHYCPWGPDNNSFWMGEIGPHLGEIWGFENFTSYHIWPQISRNPVIRCVQCLARWKTPRTSIDSGILKKIPVLQFSQSAIKVGKNSWNWPFRENTLKSNSHCYIKGCNFAGFYIELGSS